ncbi:unnamed protein product [Haemonchus placei]|uniref:Zot domain-containing protein n=1 Tax=Haemonchus placei TaxID=6290 RepID=A0A0N4WKA7_HAEPC|nr:unnamed protein product [Haemonchus placei]
MFDGSVVFFIDVVDSGIFPSIPKGGEAVQLMEALGPRFRNFVALSLPTEKQNLAWRTRWSDPYLTSEQQRRQSGKKMI